jgi:cobalt-zinc-cadmium efflux system membrane fusion protein
VDAVVQQVQVAAGDAVPARGALVQLDSPALVGWQREHREAQLQRDLARRVAERDASLLEEGLIPAQRAQASRTALDSAEAALREQQQRLQLSGVRPDAGLSGHAAVLAPTAGRVAEVMVQPGQRVAAGTPLLSLALPGPLWLVLQAPADAAAQLRVGDPVQVPGCATPAWVQTLNVQVDALSQLRLVRAAWPDAPACVLPGQRVEAEVRLRAVADAWWLPGAALVRQDGRDQVYLQRPGGYEAVPVQRLAQGADGRVQVRPQQGRWTAQDRIVVQGAVALKGLAAGLSGEQ